jgi:hypothetical protein
VAAGKRESVQIVILPDTLATAVMSVLRLLFQIFVAVCVVCVVGLCLGADEVAKGRDDQHSTGLAKLGTPTTDLLAAVGTELEAQ